MMVDRLMKALRERTVSWSALCEAPDEKTYHGLAESLEDSLREATVVDVDNIAKFYYQGTDQEMWDYKDDFPNIAPPWPVTFFEWTTPSWWRSEGKIVNYGIPTIRNGVLVLAQTNVYEETIKRFEDMPDQDLISYMIQSRSVTSDDLRNLMMQHGGAKLLEEVIGSLDRKDVPEARQRLIGQVMAHADEAPTWAMEAMCFSELQGRIFLHPVKLSWLVSKDGQYQYMSEDRKGLLMGFFTQPKDQDAKAALESVQGMAGPLVHVPFLAQSFLHCKNTVVEDHEPSAALQMSRASKRKQPLINWKTLRIEPVKEILKTKGGIDSNGLKKALHICRGHFKDYTNGGGLFGKYTGLYWWEMHTRGDSKQGAVMKDYAVQRP